MLAEYLVGVPTETVCTMAVRTGTGGWLAAAFSLQEACEKREGAGQSPEPRELSISCLLLPKRFLELRFCAPECQQALLVFVIRICNRSLLVEYVAQQDH